MQPRTESAPIDDRWLSSQAWMLTIQLITHVSDAVSELFGINQPSGRLTRSTSSLWVEAARRMLSEVPTW